MQQQTITRTRNNKEFKLFVRDKSSDLMVIDSIFMGDPKWGYEQHTSINPEERWIDIGAHIGTFSLLVQVLGGRVYGFEPDPSSYIQYLNNHQTNNLQPHISNMAVLYNTQNKKFIDFNTNSTKPDANSVFVKRSNSVTTRVPCISFEEAISIGVSVMGNNGPLCLKMDAEGVEVEILENWKHLEIQKILFEYHFLIDPSYDRFLGVLENLKKFGYETHYNSKYIKKGGRCKCLAYHGTVFVTAVKT